VGYTQRWSISLPVVCYQPIRGNAPNDMTLNQIRTFAAVSRYLNMTRAAESLHISEPSVFQQVKSLEQYCGVRLYRKVGRQIELTREGRLVQADAREILLRVERLRQRFMPEIKFAKRGSLVVGASHGPSVTLVPSLLAAFKKSHPLAQVALRTRSSRAIERLILEGQAEIGLITNPSNLPALHVVPYRRENVVTVVSAHHPLAKKKELTLAELTQSPLIIRKGSEGSTSGILKQMEDLGFQLNILMECESGEAIKIAAIKGMGVGILYQDHLQGEIKRGDLKVLRIPELKKIDVQSFMVYHQQRPLSPNAQDFLDLLRQSRPGALRLSYVASRSVRIDAAV
jgi:DNA-binding transcriptional LysR family regulator